MPYLYYQHCSSNFVVAPEYKMEHFTKESDEQVGTYYYYSFARIKNRIQAKQKKLEGFIKRIYVPEEEVLKFGNAEEDYYTYDPLSDTPELYLEMNKIEVLNDASLMKFIKNYGIPFDIQMNDKEDELIGPISLFPKNDTVKFNTEMDVLTFYEELLELQTSFKMWHCIKENNREYMQQVKDEFADFAQVFFTERTEDLSPEELAFLKANERSSELIMTWEQVKNTDLQNIAFAYLNIKLKQRNSGKTSTRLADGKIIPAISFNNLLEVASYQLKQAIFKDEKLEKCLNCGALFEARHAAQKFCSPLPGRKRSTCENTYNQRLKRLRKKQGLTEDK